MIVFDTNIISEPSRPSPDRNVLRWINKQQIDAIYLCSPVVMELEFGARRYWSKFGSDRYLTALQIHLKTFNGRILSFDTDSARMAGELRAGAESEGRSFGGADLMIAAICLHHGATLATRNIRHFEGLGLELVNPFQLAL